MDADEKKVVDEEAIAEEEFVADLEDTIENPLVYDGDKLTVQDKPKDSEVGGEKKELEGAVGTGDLLVATPFNNEEALRNEKLSDEEGSLSSGEASGPKVDGVSDAAPAGGLAVGSNDGEKNTPSEAPKNEPDPVPAPTIEELAARAVLEEKRKAVLVMAVTILISLMIGIIVGCLVWLVAVRLFGN